MDFGPPTMRVSVLGSGSSGNAVVVRSGSHQVLLDAGFSCKELERRMSDVGVDPAGFSAILLTHEHTDHVCGASRFSRKWEVPVYATQGTLAAVGPRLQSCAAATLRAERAAEIGPFVVEPFAISHDAREPVGFVIEDDLGNRIGLLSDAGSRSASVWAALRDLDVLILEANHDLDMLREGPYPWPLKQRIASDVGHLSNHEAAAGLPELLSDRLGQIVLYHLSRTNNRPALAASEIGEVLAREGSAAELHVALQSEPLKWIEVETAEAAVTQIPAGTTPARAGSLHR